MPEMSSGTGSPEGSGTGSPEGGIEQRRIIGAKTNTLRLRKELSILHGVGLLVADIIGSGIFLSPNSVIARTGSYGLSIIIWILSACCCKDNALYILYIIPLLNINCSMRDHQVLNSMCCAE